MATEIQTTTDTEDPSGTTPLATVGRVHEVGIDGVGYMLADMSDQQQDQRYRRVRVPLTQERFATSDTPFSDAVQRYVFAAAETFVGGMGQHFAERTGADGARYWDSQGVDPFTNPGTLTLLGGTEKQKTTDEGLAMAVAAGRRQYWTTGADVVGYRTASSGSFISMGALTDLLDLASDGLYAYCVDDGALKRGATSWSSWGSFTDAVYLAFAGQRMCMSERAGSSLTPNQWDTLSEDGSREVATPRLTLDEGWSVGKATGGSGYVWFPAWSDDMSVIYRWQPGTNSSPAIVYELPEGVQLKAESLFFYQGQLMMRAYHRDEDTTTLEAYIYRAPVDQEGVPIPQLVLTLEESGEDHSVGGWGADDRFVYFGWSKMDGTNAGIGCIDLSTGGYAKWLQSDEAGVVRHIHLWRRRVWFTVDSVGLIREKLAQKVTSGYLTTSVFDKRSTLMKVWDEVKVVTDVMPAGATIDVDVSSDDGATWTTLNDASDQDGAVGVTVDWDVRAFTGAIKVTLNRATDVSTGPTIHLVQGRAHMLGLTDKVVVVPINCYDRVADLRGGELPESRRDAGATRARLLEGKTQKRVLFQDIDYAETGTTEIMEVENVDVVAVMVRDPQSGRSNQGLVAVVTLRRRVG